MTAQHCASTAPDQLCRGTLPQVPLPLFAHGLSREELRFLQEFVDCYLRLPDPPATLIGFAIRKQADQPAAGLIARGLVEERSGQYCLTQRGELEVTILLKQHHLSSE